MNSAFHVPEGSSGDSHAIVVQFEMIVSRMSGSNQLLSTSHNGGAARLVAGPKTAPRLPHGTGVRSARGPRLAFLLRPKAAR